MGLTLMKEEIAANTAPGNKNVKYTKAMDWLTLTEEVTANAHSAVDVLNDFLNYDKVQSGKLSLECTIVPIFSLIERTVTEFKLPALKNNLHVSINTPLPPSDQGKDRDLSNERFVVGDAIRLTQVLRNLISNAIKFTPDDGKELFIIICTINNNRRHGFHLIHSFSTQTTGKVSVKASWMSPPQESKNPDSKKSFVLQKGDSIDVEPMGHLLLTVTDTGVGMTQDEIKNVFRQGTQFNVNTLQAGNGSGLGTYIAKGIVKQHDGLLTASSEGLNCGSTFSVTLPVYDILEEQLPSALKKRVDTEDDRESGPLKILVVDDAKMNLKLLMRLLERHGHIVDGAEDGHIAVDKVKAAMEVNTEYDVILMDYQMPGMDGPTASRKIREMGCDAFLVGVTGNVMPEDVNFFKAAGANSVLAKPVKLPDLEALWVEYGVHGNVNVGEDWARAGAHGRNGEDQRPRVSKIELI
jgi:signal transduction histidine kinase/CheY-like chemotaxis protein